MIVKMLALLFGIAGLSVLVFGFASDHQALAVDGTDVSGPPPAAAQTASGCLTTGADSRRFFLREAGSKELVEVVSKEDLTVYVGKRVKLTGTLEEAGGKRVFRVVEIVVLAQSCPAG